MSKADRTIWRNYARGIRTRRDRSFRRTAFGHFRQSAVRIWTNVVGRNLERGRGGFLAPMVIDRRPRP